MHANLGTWPFNRIWYIVERGESIIIIRITIGEVVVVVVEELIGKIFKGRIEVIGFHLIEVIIIIIVVYIMIKCFFVYNIDSFGKHLLSIMIQPLKIGFLGLSHLLIKLELALYFL